MKQTALLLGAIACLSIMVHVGHADSAHIKPGNHECGLCQSLSSASVPAPAPSAAMFFLVAALFVSAIIFLSNDSLLVAASRGPPYR